MQCSVTTKQQLKNCLEYFKLTDRLAVGKPTTMVKTIQAMLAGDVVSL